MRKVSRRGVAAARAEGKSLCARLAPSSGAQGSNGIQRRERRPRMDKQEYEVRLRGMGNRDGRTMRFAGGEQLARDLIEAAEKSVGAHHSEPYRRRIKYLCEDLELLRRRLKDLARDIEKKVDEHEIAKLIMTIEGVGPLTAACLIAELGDPARFDSPGAIASYVGVIPRIRQSGKKRFTKGPLIPLGNARLRKALWMVML